MRCHWSYHARGTCCHCDLQTLTWYEEGIVFRTCFMVGIGGFTELTHALISDSLLQTLCTRCQTIRIPCAIVLQMPARGGCVGIALLPVEPSSEGSRADGCQDPWLELCKFGSLMGVSMMSYETLCWERGQFEVVRYFAHVLFQETGLSLKFSPPFTAFPLDQTSKEDI
jgi:hypothetical protein